MADEYIKRFKAINALQSLPTWWADEGGVYGGAKKPMEALLYPEDAVSAIENIPSADVRPVIRGRWVQVMGKYDWMVKCSRCNGVPLETSNFCPRCGARMDGKDINVATNEDYGT